MEAPTAAGAGPTAAAGPPELEALRALARAHGVETEYRDIAGERREAGPEALVATLRALGAPLESPADAADALRARRLAVWRRPLEPVAVARAGDDATAVVRLPAGMDPGRLRAFLRLEDGGTRELSLDAAALEEVASEEVEGRLRVERRLRLPGPLPPGHHRLRLEGLPREAGGGAGGAGPARGPGASAARDGRAEALVLSAPATAWHPPEAAGRVGRWGVFLPLYALRTADDWGIGDFSGLRRLMAWIAGQGGDLAGTLPLLSAFLDAPFDPSPYAPVSRMFWNELYVDATRAPGWEPGLLGDPAATGRAAALDPAALRAEPEVDYRRCARLRRGALEAAARRFFAAGGESSPGFRAFLESRPEVEDYARFRAAAELRGAGWPAWPAPQRDGTLAPRDYGSDAVRYHVYAQWVAEEQLGEVARAAGREGAGLYLDLPLGAHPDGYDTWRFGDAFARGASTGAPPDDFFREGQDWGFPPLHPERIRESGYAYTTACLRHSLSHAGALRVDHVMALHRLFWVPPGFPAREGVYVRYRPEEMWALLCLESHRARAAVIGEDLGTVPDAVRAAMARHDVDGMYVVQYEARPEPERPLPETPRRSLACLQTHDMYPFAAFWEGLDIRHRRSLGLLDAETAEAERERRGRIRAEVEAFLRRQGLLEGSSTESVLRACLGWLAAGAARTLLVNLEDLWLEERPQNLPGTSGDVPNWRRRVPYELEEIRDMGQVRETLEPMRRLRSRSPGPGGETSAAASGEGRGGQGSGEGP